MSEQTVEQELPQEQHLLQWLRDRISGTHVQLYTPETRTRNIGPAGASQRSDTLHIGQPFACEVLSQRAGYLTLINIGTSGDVILLTPNHYGDVAASHLEAGRHLIPGAHPLKWDDLKSEGFDTLEEQGPQGWEHLIAIISDTPLVGDATLQQAQPAGPFYKLQDAQLPHLLDALQSAPADSLAFDMTSFLVIAGDG